jgi:gamma-glutamylcyclotransferase (GGCT)/AIG2-like uncharacterized protein YtfP
MCIIIHKPKAGIIPANILDNAETKNADGFGITFLDTMETFKTMDYDKARVMAENERPFVLHYRYATVGDVNEENCHPFPAKDGVMYSNGTVADLGNKKQSDTAVVAEMLDRTPKKYWKDMLSMSEVRFAIINGKGEVSRFGKWHHRNGVFYSKDNCFGWHNTRATVAPYYSQTNHHSGGGYANGANGGKTGTGYSAPGWKKIGGSTFRKVDEPVGAPTSSPPVTKNNTVLGYSSWDADPHEGDVEPVVEDTKPIEDADVMSDKEFEDMRGQLSEMDEYELIRAYNFGAISLRDYNEAVGNTIEDDEVEAVVTVKDEDYRTDWDIEEGVGDWEDLDVVAVYGTLKCGFGNHKLLKDAEFLGEAHSVEKLRMSCYGIPYVYDGDCDEGHNIEVELYEVKGTHEKTKIDWLENHPHHYKRVRKQFVSPMGILCEAWVYVAQHLPYEGDIFFPKYTGRVQAI